MVGLEASEVMTLSLSQSEATFNISIFEIWLNTIATASLYDNTVPGRLLSGGPGGGMFQELPMQDNYRKQKLPWKLWVDLADRGIKRMLKDWKH